MAAMRAAHCTKRSRAIADAFWRRATRGRRAKRRGAIAPVADASAAKLTDAEKAKDPYLTAKKVAADAAATTTAPAKTEVRSPPRARYLPPAACLPPSLIAVPNSRTLR